MILLVGLGNPGKKYEKTRHNAGFHVIDALVAKHGLPEPREKFSGLFTKGTIAGRDVALLKPQTFMNVSGDSVQPAQAFLKVSLSEIVCIHDELDIPFGDVRVKVGGGSAGHNGLKSLTGRLGSPDYVRVRMGIGRPPPGFRGDVADFVLSSFGAIEVAEWPDVVQKGCAAVETVVEQGALAAMNVSNTRKK